MLGKKKFEPKFIYNESLDDLVPSDDIYRLLDRFLDLRFLYKECERYYGITGKPSIDPVVFFKLQIFGYLENIISDRELVRRANDSLAIRYFIGYDFGERLPWHSTISRTRSLLGKDVFESMFNKVLELCYQSGLIEGSHQTIDSTLVKANASMDTLERKRPKLTVHQYAEKTYEENQEEKTENRDDEDIDKRDKKNNKLNDQFESITDRDSKIITRPGKPTDLYYKTQYCADTKNRVITDVLTTEATVSDKASLMDVIKRSQERLDGFGLRIDVVSADKGYCSGKNLRELEVRDIQAFIPSPKAVNSRGEIDKDEFRYDNIEDVFICPNQKQLRFSGYDKDRESNRYKANKKDCLGCPLKERCCPNSKARSIRQSIYYEEYERLAERVKTRQGKSAAMIRKIVSEGLFAEAKNCHGLRKFMTRGLAKAQKCSFMAATVQNLKRLLKNYRKYPLKSTLHLERNLFFHFNEIQLPENPYTASLLLL